MIKTILIGTTAIICILASIIYGMNVTPINDFSNLSMTESFKKLNEIMKSDYPFTPWKEINWDKYYKETLPDIEKAQREDNKDLFYLSLRNYIYKTHDGHVTITDNPNLRYKNIGGNYGINIICSTDEKYYISRIFKDNLRKLRIEPGTEVIKWNEENIEDAVKKTNVVWSHKVITTKEIEKKEKIKFLTRGKIGEKVKIIIKQKTGEEKEINLIAEEDNYESLKYKDKEPIISWKILKSGFGYIAITSLVPDLGTLSITDKVGEALQKFKEENIKGVIIDVRNNEGGMDSIAAEICGYFLKAEKLYQYKGNYDFEKNKYVITLESHPLYSKPQKLYFDGKIIVLINEKTASSGEGIPKMLKGMNNVKIVGLNSTEGSFGIFSGLNGGAPDVKMPGGYCISFPSNVSLNEKMEVQIDSKNMEGGIFPDIRPEINKQNLFRYINGEDIELETSEEILKKLIKE